MILDKVSFKVKNTIRDKVNMAYSDDFLPNMQSFHFLTNGTPILFEAAMGPVKNTQFSGLLQQGMIVIVSGKERIDGNLLDGTLEKAIIFLI